MKTAAILLAGGLLFSCSGNKSSSADAVKDATPAVANGATAGGASNTSSTYKKYDLKSGIVTFTSVMSIGTMEISSKRMLYFDDYGLKECEEEYGLDAGTAVLKTRNFVKDGIHYTCSVENKGGMKTKALGYGVAAPFNMEEAERSKNSQFKKLPDETVCGKTCNGFTMETGSGTIQMFGWKHVCLKTTLDNAKMKMKSTTTATAFEENATIPSNIFEVPAGVVMTDK